MNKRHELPYLEPSFNWEQCYLAAEDQGDERTTWAYDWPAGERFGSDLLNGLEDLSGKRVCDLGCGRGQLGFIALHLGAHSVHFCDHSSQILAYVQAKIDYNKLDKNGQTKQHRWGTRIPGAPFDVILGGDILYRPECFDALLASIASSLAPGGHALLSDPRTELEKELYELAITHSLIINAKRHETYTLINFRCE